MPDKGQREIQKPEENVIVKEDNNHEGYTDNAG